jgi:hypothetical protein
MLNAVVAAQVSRNPNEKALMLNAGLAAQERRK